MEADVRDAWLTLTLASGFGPRVIARLIDAADSVVDVPAMSVRDLRAVDGIGAQTARDLRAALDEVAQSEALPRELELIDEHGVTLIALGEAGYPKLLTHIHDPPPLLYVRGELREADALALAVVGSRRCTQYGREQADRLAALAASAGLCIISGGAYGIDAAAHRAALRVRGRTVAVLGSGLANIYPREHDELFDQIAEQGAVISELPMHTAPSRQNFPRRNRIISGLSLGVLVVEAPLRSGALITARLAVEEHGREVMAVPGRVDSRASEGCHKIIREGWATLVTSGAELLDALGEAGQLLKADLNVDDNDQRREQQTPLFDQAMTESQRSIVAAMDSQTTFDQLAAATGLSAATIQADLTILQIRGVVAQAGGRYTRRGGD